MKREPLSRSILNTVATGSAGGALTLNRLLEQTEGRGIHLVIILLCLPFITPVPLPGISTVVGVIILILCLRQILRLPPRLPKFMGEHPIRLAEQDRILRASLRFLNVVEKVVRPRGKGWLDNPVARLGNQLVLCLLAGLLIVPFPPFVFFTNSLPSYAIILIAASMMEGDAVLIWFGYLATALSLVYFSFIIGGSLMMIHRHWQTIVDFTRSLL